MSVDRLGELAVIATADPAGAPVLADYILETGWRDERVMMLCLGVPLDTRPPDTLGERGRSNWRQSRQDSIGYADRQWELYAGSARADFARAVLAVLIFGEWKMRGNTGAGPWAVMRKADPDHQARLSGRRFSREAEKQFRAAREVRENALRAVRRESEKESDAQSYRHPPADGPRGPSTAVLVAVLIAWAAAFAWAAIHATICG